MLEATCDVCGGKSEPTVNFPPDFYQTPIGGETIIACEYCKRKINKIWQEENERTNIAIRCLIKEEKAKFRKLSKMSHSKQAEETRDLPIERKQELMRGLVIGLMG